MDAEAANTELDQLLTALSQTAGEDAVAASRALRAHKAKLVEERLTTAAVLQDTTQDELTDKFKIPHGDAKRIKRVFKAAGSSTVSISTQEPDQSVEHLKLLLPAPPNPLPATAAAVKGYLADFTGMKIPVNDSTWRALCSMYQAVMQYLTLTSNSRLTTSLSALLDTDIIDRGSEHTATALVSYLWQYTVGRFDRLLGGPFPHTLLGNKSASAASSGSTSGVIRKRQRCDSHLVAESLTLFLGEDKQTGGMAAAVADIMRKVTCVDPVFYGQAPFLLAYTAAGYNIKFYSIFAQDTETPALEAASPELALDTVPGRVNAVLVLAKLYMLLRALVEAIPKPAGGHPLFSMLQRVDGVTIQFLGNGVEKRIPSYADWCKKYHVDEEAVKRAYDAAKQAAQVAKAANQPAALITALDGPEISGGTWSVTAGPLLYECAAPTTELELQDLAFAACTAAAALHEQNVVHRDLRLANMMRRTNPRHFVVIDPDMASFAAVKKLPTGFKLAEWELKAGGAGTLNRKRQYDKFSDMFQIGVMLGKCGVANLSAPAVQFITALKQKALTAKAALQHPWLLQRPPA